MHPSLRTDVAKEEALSLISLPLHHPHHHSVKSNTHNTSRGGMSNANFIEDVQQLIDLLSNLQPIIVVSGDSVSHLADLYAHLPHILCHTWLPSSPPTTEPTPYPEAASSCTTTTTATIWRARRRQREAGTSRPCERTSHTASVLHLVGHAHAFRGLRYCRENHAYVRLNRRFCVRSRAVHGARTRTNTNDNKDKNESGSAHGHRRRVPSHCHPRQRCTRRKERRLKAALTRGAHARAPTRHGACGTSPRSSEVSHYLRKLRAFEARQRWVVACFVSCADDVVGVLSAWNRVENMGTQFILFCNTDLLDGVLYRFHGTQKGMPIAETRWSCAIPSAQQPQHEEATQEKQEKKKEKGGHAKIKNAAHVQRASFVDHVYRRGGALQKRCMSWLLSPSLTFPVLHVHTSAKQQGLRRTIEHMIACPHWRSFLAPSRLTRPRALQETNRMPPSSPYSHIAARDAGDSYTTRRSASWLRHTTPNFFSWSNVHADAASMQVAQQLTQQAMAHRMRRRLADATRVRYDMRSTTQHANQPKQMTYSPSHSTHLLSCCHPPESNEADPVGPPCMQFYFPMVTSVGSHLTSIASMSDIFVCEFSSVVWSQGKHSPTSIEYNTSVPSDRARRSRVGAHTSESTRADAGHRIHTPIHYITHRANDHNYPCNYNFDRMSHEDPCYRTGGSVGMAGGPHLCEHTARLALENATRRYVLHQRDAYEMDTMIAQLRHYLGTLAAGRQVYSWCVTDAVECLPRVAWCMSYEHHHPILNTTASQPTASCFGQGDSDAACDRTGRDMRRAHRFAWSRSYEASYTHQAESVDTSTMTWQLHRTLTLLRRMGWVCVSQELHPRAAEGQQEEERACLTGNVTRDENKSRDAVRDRSAHTRVTDRHASSHRISTAAAAHDDFWQAVLVSLSDGVCLWRGQRIKLDDGRVALVVDFQPVEYTHPDLVECKDHAYDCARARVQQMHAKRRSVPDGARWRPSMPSHVTAMQTTRWPVVRVLRTGELLHLFPTRTHRVDVDYPVWCFVSASQQRAHKEGREAFGATATSLNLYMDAQWRMCAAAPAGRQVSLMSLPLLVYAAETVSMAYVAEVRRRTQCVCHRLTAYPPRAKSATAKAAVIARCGYGVCTETSGGRVCRGSGADWPRRRRRRVTSRCRRTVECG